MPNGKRKRLVTHDELIRLLEADSKELVKFVNAVLGAKHDPETAEVKFLQNKLQQLIDPTGKIDGSMATDLKADTFFSINGIIYQIEAQTQHDNTMLFRLVEYQLNGLLANLSELQLDSKHKVSIPLPQMAMIAIDKSDQTPDFYEVEYIDTHTEEKLVQRFPVVKLWEESIESLMQDGKKLMLPFLVNSYKKVFAKNPMDEQAAKDFVKDSLEILGALDKLKNQVSDAVLHEMKTAQIALTHGFLSEYIGKNNPARKEVEDMVMFEERKRRPNSAELLIEQGKASLQPVIERLTRDVKTLQSNYQTLQGNYQTIQTSNQTLQSNYQAIQSNYQTIQSNYQTIQTKLQAEQLEKLTLQKQNEELKAQLARLKGS